MIKKQRRKRSNEQGQAIFELIAFFPLFMLFFTVITYIGNAINASINQQKAVRGILFNDLRNNSTYPSTYIIGRRSSAALNFGHHAIGYANTFVNGTTPVASCWKIPHFFSDTGEACTENSPDETTQHIRVKTGFGICGTTLSVAEEGSFRINRDAMYNPATAYNCVVK